MLPAVCLLAWRWGLSAFLVSLHTFSKRKKANVSYLRQLYITDQRAKLADVI